MPITINYTNRTPTSATVVAIVEAPAGVCHVSAKLFPSDAPLGTPQFFNGCPPMVIWEVTNVPTEILESQVPRVTARVCGNDPNRTLAQAECLGDRPTAISELGRPYPRMPTSSTPGPRCPGIAMGDCSFNSQCGLARERLDEARVDIRTLCESYRRYNDQAAVYRALLLAYTLAAGTAYFLAIAIAATVPPPFGTVGAILAFALAVALTIAAAAALALMVRDEARALDYVTHIQNYIQDYSRILHEVESLCICQGCGVRTADIELPLVCRGIHLPNNTTLVR